MASTQGGTVASDDWDHQIIIFRDTLVRDFGHDPAWLRHQVTMTAQHELAHHLGASERHLAELGPSDVSTTPGPHAGRRHRGRARPVAPSARS